MPFVASEKKVEAWVVSMLRENVYETWKPRPRLEARRSSATIALYQESPSLVLVSMAEKDRLGRGEPAAKKSDPSGSSVGVGTLASVFRSRFFPRAPA